MGGQHYYHNASGPVDIDLFNNLTSSGSNHHAAPSIANVNTTTTSMGGADGRNLVVVGILIALIVLLCLFLALVAIPPMYAIWRSTVPVNPKKVERRYRTIEGWLISKRIHDHDEHCDRARRAYAENREQPRKEPSDAPPPIDACLSADETVDSNSSAPCCGVETACCEAPKCKGGDQKEVNVMSCVEEHECPICMEPFLVGQTVSWAASTSCEHVFHHSCIKEWLLRHIHCPCCREIYLLVDCPQQKKFTTADLQKLAGERKKRYDQTYFCVKEGLVTLYGLPPSPSNSERKSDELLVTVKSKTKSGVSKSLLATMRSTPLEGESCSPSAPSSPSPRSTSLVEETQQPTSTSSSSAPSASDTTPVEPNTQLQPAPLFVPQWDVPFDEVSASDSNVVSRTETDSSLRPSHLSLNTPIASTKSPRINKSIWRGVDEGKEIPSVLMPLSKSLIGEDFDVEDGQVMAVVRQTDSFKENQTESPKVKAKAKTLIMGSSKGPNRRSDSAKPKVSVTVTQPFLSENYQNV